LGIFGVQSSPATAEMPNARNAGTCARPLHSKDKTVTTSDKRVDKKDTPEFLQHENQELAPRNFGIRGITHAPSVTDTVCIPFPFNDVASVLD
jgi:hypothetical protein